jgi:hypothetical protein
MIQRALPVDFGKTDVGPVLYQEIGFTISWYNGLNGGSISYLGFGKERS